jgi:hypothetical protein
MYNCLLGITRYYLTKPCLDLKSLENNKNIVWYLKHGTIVKATNTDDIKYILQEQLFICNFFWATQITDTLWEVQFSKEQDPIVKFIVDAESGIEAGKNAKKILKLDYDEINIVEYNIL